MTGGCPLADECPAFEETIEGMGCQNHCNRGGVEWCAHYGSPIRELRSQPVLVGDVVEVETERYHETGAVLAFIDGFAVFVEDCSPDLRARVRITRVLQDTSARAETIEVLGPVDHDPVEEPDSAPSLGARGDWWNEAYADGR